MQWNGTCSSSDSGTSRVAASTATWATWRKKKEAMKRAGNHLPLICTTIFSPTCGAGRSKCSGTWQRSCWCRPTRQSYAGHVSPSSRPYTCALTSVHISRGRRSESSSYHMAGRMNIHLKFDVLRFDVQPGFWPIQALTHVMSISCLNRI